MEVERPETSARSSGKDVQNQKEPTNQNQNKLNSSNEPASEEEGTNGLNEEILPGGLCTMDESKIVERGDEKQRSRKTILEIKAADEESVVQTLKNRIAHETDDHFSSTPDDSEAENSDTGKARGIKPLVSPAVISGIIEPELARRTLSRESDEETFDLGAYARHLFVLSEAGKPIFTLYGNEEALVSLMGLIQAIVSLVEARPTPQRHHSTTTTNHHRTDSGGSHHFADQLWSLRTPRGRTISFCHRPPLILMAVGWAKSHPSRSRLQHWIELVYSQILSVLTKSQLNRIFDHRKNFDLRRLLKGTEASLGSIVKMSCCDPSIMLNSVRCLPMNSTDRDAVGQSLVSTVSAAKIKNVVFSMLVAEQQLVCMVRMKKYLLHPADIHLVINLVLCNPSFRHAESWTPVCLPRFDDTGFLHAHISYLNDGCSACLLLLTTERDSFYSLSTVKAKFVEKLNRSKLIGPLAEACRGAKAVRLSELSLPDLWHFLYKNRTSSQLCCPTFEPPYVSPQERRRLVEIYAEVIERVQNDDGGKSPLTDGNRPLKTYYYPGERETVIAWVTSNFELYATFSPLVLQQAAVAKIDKLMRFLKKEESRLFILSPQVF